ncbi:MAG: MATE family efflux transporter [Treponema sp.]|nr:MATE family efflux transporter [Treponema sp.]
MDMTQSRILPVFIKFSFPLLFGNLFQLFYSLTDSFIVGNYLGSLSLAAIGASGNIIFTVTGFFNGLANGAGVVVSQTYGAKDKVRLLSTVRSAMLSSIALGLLLTAFGMTISPFMLKMISVPGEVFTQAVLYLRIYFSGVIFILFYNLCAGFLRALGESKKTFYILVLSVILNIILDFIFILIFKQGLKGAAFATVISEAFSALFALITLNIQLRKLNFIQDSRIKKHFSSFALISILKIGLPGAISSLLLNFSNTFMQRYINRFGADCMAGWAVYARFDELSILAMVSICATAMTFTGQNYGAGKMDRVYKGIKAACLLGGLEILLIATLLITFAPALASIFNPEASVIRYGAMFIRASASFYLFCFGTMVFCQISQGLGYTTVPTIIIFSGFVLLRQTYLFTITKLTDSSLAVALAYPFSWPPTLVFEVIYLRCKLKRMSSIHSNS